MRYARSSDRDDFDVEARRPSLAAILALTLVATALALTMVQVLGALLDAVMP